jgi:SAM-dependent methyltransferase
MAETSTAARRPIYAPYTSAESPVVPDYWVQRYEHEAARYWDRFYTRNADRFFKDRHYLQREWSELKPQDGDDGDDGDGATAERDEVSSLCAGSSELILLEAGCGAGNTMLPLMRANPRLRVYAFDFSEVAVRLVQADPLYQTGRIVAAVGDLTSGTLPVALAGCRAHLCTLMFVLSAISEPKMAAALTAVRAGLRDGGLVLFRDYAIGAAPPVISPASDLSSAPHDRHAAVGDGAQRRLQHARGSKQLDESARFFVRQVDRSRHPLPIPTPAIARILTRCASLRNARAPGRHARLLLLGRAAAHDVECRGLRRMAAW